MAGKRYPYKGNKSWESVPFKDAASIKSKEVLPDPEIRQIDHVNDNIDLEPIYKMVEVVSDFCNLLKSVTERHGANGRMISQCDLNICDLMHEAELLPSLNARDGYKFYKRIRSLRLKRRLAKTENIILDPLFDFINENPVFVAKIKTLQEQCDKAKQGVEGYTYMYRIQDSELTS